MLLATVAACALAGIAALAAPAAADTALPDGDCAPLRPQLRAAFDDAPTMALANHTKVERLLRDARRTDSAEVCRVKLVRAHELVAEAYADAGRTLELAGGDGG